MKLSYYFAKRYLFSKKSTQAINIISLISVIGVCIGTSALFIILSVFNGFEELNLLYYKQLNPDLKITKVGEENFSQKEITHYLNTIPKDVIQVKVLENQALLRYQQNPYYAVVKGVSEDFLKIKGLDTSLVAGKFFFEDDYTSYAVIGNGIAYQLGIEVDKTLEQISVFAPKPNTKINTLDPMSSLTRKEVFPAGVFSVLQDMDEKNIFVSLDFSQKLFNAQDKISGVELYVNNEKQMLQVQENLQHLIPENFVIKNRYELNEILYKVLNTERWAVYLVMSFILLVAICNIIGAITMLIIDKKKDIAVLKAMGMSDQTIRRIYLIQGLLISLIGVVIGLLIGTAFVILQEKYGLIRINGSEEFLIQAYPVKLLFRDHILVFLTVTFLSLITGWFTSKQSTSQTKQNIQENFVTR